MDAADPPDFDIHERHDADGAVRLVLRGELDIAVADDVTNRLRELAGEGASARIDLSELTFIDSSGIRMLMRALEHSSRDGWDLEIDPDAPQTVRRTIELAGVAGHFWPGGSAAGGHNGHS